MRNSRIILVALAAISLATACQKAEQSGAVTIALEEGPVAEIVTRSNVSDYAALPSEGSFDLSITSGKNTIWSGPLSTWDTEMKIKAGTYTATVTCGDPEVEGPARPYFAGSAEFAVFGGQTSTVSIPVTLGNCVIRIECTDAFKNYFTSSSFTVTTGAGNVFEYAGEALFIDAYKFSIVGKGTTQAGKEYNFEEKNWNVSAATCYTVRYDVSNVGGLTVTVSFDDSVETVYFSQELND